MNRLKIILLIFSLIIATPFYTFADKLFVQDCLMSQPMRCVTLPLLLESGPYIYNENHTPDTEFLNSELEISIKASLTEQQLTLDYHVPFVIGKEIKTVNPDGTVAWFKLLQDKANIKTTIIVDSSCTITKSKKREIYLLVDETETPLDDIPQCKNIK